MPLAASKLAAEVAPKPAGIPVFWAGFALTGSSGAMVFYPRRRG